MKKQTLTAASKYPGKHALILSDHPNIAQSIMHCLARNGITSIVIGNSNSRFLAVSRFCKSSIILGDEVFKDDVFKAGNDSLLGDIEWATENYSICAVFATGHDSTQFLCKRNRDIERIAPTSPLPDLDIFDELYDKRRFSTLLDRCSLPQPVTAIVNNMNEIEHTKNAVPFPALIKPAKQHGGKGIHLFDSFELMTNYLARAVNEQKNSSIFPMIVQEFIPGHDIDLSVLAIHGRIVAWTVQQRRPGGVFTFSNHPDVFAIGKRVVRELGYHGVAHFDLRIDVRDGSIKAIECNPRFWATTYESCFAGVNFPALCIDHINDLDWKDFTFTPRPATVISMRRVAMSVIKGPSGWKELNAGALLKSHRSDTSDQLPYFFDFLSGKNSWLADRLGAVFIRQKNRQSTEAQRKYF